MPGGFLGDAWNATTHFVEGAVSDLEHVVSSALSDLEQLGIAAFDGLEFLVKYLIQRGEDPVSFISRLKSHIDARGADPIAVLVTLTGGIMEYGLEGYTQRMVEQALSPLIAGLQQQSRQGQALASLHQTTVTGIHSKLDALYTGQTSSGLAFKGDLQATVSTRFDYTAANLSQLTVSMDTSDGGTTQDQINQDFIHGLQMLGDQIKYMLLFDVAVLGVEAIIAGFSGGVAVIGEVPLDGVIAGAELIYILIFIAVDALIWLVRSIALAVSSVLDRPAPPQTNNPPNTTPYQPPTDPNGDPVPWGKVAIAIVALLGAAVLAKKIVDLTAQEHQDVVNSIATEMGCDPGAVENFLKAHPDLTVQDALRYLSAQRTIAQEQQLLADLQAKLADPKYADPQLQASIRRMQARIQAQINTLTDLENQILAGKTPANVDAQLTAAQNNLNGMWAEWQIAQYYADRGELLSFGTNIGGREIDIVIRDGNSIRFIQVKDYLDSWGINPGGDPSKFSKRWLDLSNQVQGTVDLAHDPNVVNGLKSQYPWFDGNINVEVNLINNQPLSHNPPGWKNVADKLRTDYGVDVQTTDPTEPAKDPNSPYYEPNNPMNDGDLYNKITNPPTPPMDWCNPPGMPLPTPAPTPNPTPTPTS